METVTNGNGKQTITITKPVGDSQEIVVANIVEEPSTIGSTRQTASITITDASGRVETITQVSETFTSTRTDGAVVAVTSEQIERDGVVVAATRLETTEALTDTATGASITRVTLVEKDTSGKEITTITETQPRNGVRYEKTVIDVTSTGTVSPTSFFNLLPGTSSVPDTLAVYLPGDISANISGNMLVQVEGPTEAQAKSFAGNALSGAIRLSNAPEFNQRTNDLSGFFIDNDLSGFFRGLANSTELNIRTISVEARTENGANTSQNVLELNGAISQDTGTRVDAIVVDVSKISNGSNLVINNIEFVSIIGAATLNGGEGDNFISAGADTQRISVGPGDDTINAGAGSDLIFGGLGDDTIDGGTGIDAARFVDGFDAISFGQDAFGKITAMTSSEGTDLLDGIEVLIANGEVRLVNAPSIITDNGFDEAFYLAHYTDIARAVQSRQFASGFDHFMAFGQYEDRNMNALYDADYYRQANADVAAAVDQGGMFQSVTQHYMLYGAIEARTPSSWFDSATYLNANPDVRAVGMSALTHYLLFGRGEGRPAYATDDALF